MGVFKWFANGFKDTQVNATSSKNTTLGDYSASSGFPAYSFRLKNWPQLSDSFKTASVYRVLSVLSTKPVSWDWISESLGQNNGHTITLLQKLQQLKALDVLQVHYAPCVHDIEKVIDLELKNARANKDVRKSGKSGF
jgi:hypothetical protein